MAENKKIEDIIGFYLPLLCIIYFFTIPVCGAIVEKYAKDETEKWILTLGFGFIVTTIVVFAIICAEKARNKKIAKLNIHMEQMKLPEVFRKGIRKSINEGNLRVAQDILDFTVSLQKNLPNNTPKIIKNKIVELIGEGNPYKAQDILNFSKSLEKLPDGSPKVIKNGIMASINEGNLRVAQNILNFAPTFNNLPDDTPDAIRNKIEDFIIEGDLDKAQDILNLSKSLLDKLPDGSPEIIKNKIVDLLVEGSWQDAEKLWKFVFVIYKFICETCEIAEGSNVLRIYYSAICSDEMFAVFVNMYSEEYKLQTFGKLYFAILPHISTLITKEKQKIMQDDYGNTIEDTWDAEIAYFLKNVCGYEMPTAEDIRNFKVIFNALKHTKIDGYEILEICQPTSIKVESGAEYEDAVKMVLENAGYKVRKTPATGDQGVDLIVTHNDKKCAIQCKFYSGTVGNKAVQEVIAGRDFYGCDFGIVCSNNTYTKSARQLAHSQNISLTSHNEIAEVIGKLAG